VTAASFFILLAIAILLMFAGNRLIPVVMPEGRLLPPVVGWLGGFLASRLDGAVWHLGPNFYGINLVAAAVGCTLALLLYGLYPFIKIMLGKV
jgi:hypothetical protein